MKKQQSKKPSSIQYDYKLMHDCCPQHMYAGTTITKVETVENKEQRRVNMKNSEVAANKKIQKDKLIEQVYLPLGSLLPDTVGELTN